MLRKQKLQPQQTKVVGPYSPGLKIGNLIFVSGQLGNLKNLEGDIKSQTKQAFENIEVVLKESDLGLSNVVKTTIFLKDLEDYEAVNRLYSIYFSAPYPARSVVEVSNLPNNSLLEVECIAVDTRKCDLQDQVINDDCGGEGCQ